MLALPACAAGQRVATQPGQPGQAADLLPDRAVLAEYLKALPIGTRVKATLAGGNVVRGTLMKVSESGIVIQPRARVPEAPVTLQLEQIRAVEPDTNGGVGRAVAIGVAVGAGAAVGVLLILAALLAD
jgi:hypothetical protein